MHPVKIWMVVFANQFLRLDVICNEYIYAINTDSRPSNLRQKQHWAHI